VDFQNRVAAGQIKETEMYLVRNIRLLLATLMLLVGLGSAQTLTSIQVVPNTVAGYTGDQIAVQVLGTYSDGSQQDVTSQVSWSSSNNTIAQVVTAQPQITLNAVNGQQVAILTAAMGTPLGVSSANLEVTVLDGNNPDELPPGSIGLSGGSTGDPTLSTSQGGPIDSLNLATDNILLTIPVRTKNEKIPFSFSLVGNSSAYVPASGPNYWAINTGIQGQVGGLLGVNVTFTSQPHQYCNGYYNDVWYSNFAIIDSSGARHPISGMGTLDLLGCPPLKTSGSGGTGDASGMSLSYNVIGNPVWTVYDMHGNSVAVLPTTGHTLTDIDGNKMYYTNTANGFSVVDSEGVTVITAALQGTANGSQDTYSYVDFNGLTQKFIVTWKGYTEYTNFLCSGGTDVHGTSGTFILPYTITIPKLTGDSTAGVYTLGYETTPGGTSGRLASISYPTGGSTTYSYGSTPINCSDLLTVPNLTRKTTDTTSGTISQWVNTNLAGILAARAESVSVVDPAGYTESYTFSNGYLTELNEANLIDTYVCYNGVASKSACVSPSTWVSPAVSQTDVYVSNDNGVANTYNHTQTQYFEALQAPTSIVRWDLPGGNTISSANSETTIGYINPKRNLYGKATIQVIDPTTSNTVAYQHNYWDSNGHLYEPCSWISGSLTGNGFKCTIFTFNSNGSINTSYEATGVTTTYNYTSGVCNQLIPTSVTNNFNSLTSSVSFSNDPSCKGGMPTSQTPVSGYSTSQTYGDPLWRMDSYKDEYGIVTNTNYRLNSITTTESFSNAGGTVNIARIKTLDSLGRVISEQTQNGSNYDTVATRYDAMGRVFFRSSPFSCATKGNCTPGAGTTTTYDAAGRVHTITDANNGVTTFTYTAGTSGADVESVLTPTPSGDQANPPTGGKTRVDEFNGLGQLKRVCEVNTYSDAITCGQTISNNGYATEYDYDAAGNLTEVAQGASQTRWFYYDGLGRMTQENNPENGITKYTYDGDPTHCTGFTTYVGDLASILRNSGSYDCFSDDKLHRLITIAGSDGKSAGFQWDSSTVNGIAVGQKGKIAEAWTCGTQGNCTQGIVTDEGFTYDERGMPNGYYQASPNSGGYYAVAELFDPLGNMIYLGGIPSMPHLGVGAYDAEGRPTLISATSGPKPVTAATYGFFGATSVTYGSQDSDSFGYDNLGHMTSYQYNIGSNYYKGTLTWNPNGTLGSLATIDTVPGNGGGNGVTTTYTYDNLIRLSTAAGGSALNQAYSYDRYGNLSTYGPPFSWIPGYNANNHYVAGGSCNGTGICYDGDGNLTSDSFNTYTWDANDKMSSVNGVSIIRDAFGRTVEANGFQFLQVPGLRSTYVQLSGQTLQTASIPLPGGGSAIYNWFGQSGLVGYNHPDWHGNTRLSSTQARGLFMQNEYSPFGQMYDFSSGCCDPQFDSAKTAIVNKGFDMDNRVLHSIQGRWLQPDPAGLSAVDVSNPQTWNRYAYALNNPLKYNDPTGLWCVWDDGTGHDADPGEGGANSDQCAGAGGHWDPYDTITNVLQANGIVTQINDISGQPCTTADCGAGGTLQQLDQTLQSYSVLGVDPIDQLQTTGDSWGDGPIHIAWQTDPQVDYTKLKKSDAVSCLLSPDASTDIAKLHLMLANTQPAPPTQTDPNGGGSTSGLGPFGAQRQNMYYLNNSNSPNGFGPSVSPSGAAKTGAAAAAADSLNSAATCLQVNAQ
jgi:RHS repeat-associated protein